MPTTEIETLKAFVKMPVIKIFIVLMLLPAGAFGWLWYDSQKTIQTQQQNEVKCKDEISKIYKEFLAKSESQIIELQKIQSQKANEKDN